MNRKRLILVGGGHAHVHVLSRAERSPIADTDLLLISTGARLHYSGMVPGYLLGTYAEEELAIDLEALAARAGARFLPAMAERIDPVSRTVEAGGQLCAFDILSINVGSEATNPSIPGLLEHAFALRPMSRSAALRARAVALFAGSSRPVAVAVVGGGAAGVEITLAILRLGRALGAEPELTLFEAGDDLLPEFPARLRRLARRALAEEGVRLRTGKAVVAVESGAIRLEDGNEEPADLTIWLAGASPPALLRQSDLPRDRRGFLLVDSTLRTVDGSPIFGAGDCIGIEGFPELPKAGVHAVRAASVLDHNLRAALRGRSARTYRPQKSFLALLNTANGRALWRWHALSGHSRLAWRVKNRIDRRFVRQYQPP